MQTDVSSEQFVNAFNTEAFWGFPQFGDSKKIITYVAGYLCCQDTLQGQGSSFIYIYFPSNQLNTWHTPAAQ